MGIVDLQDHKKLEILRSQIEGFKVSDVMDTEYPTLDPEDRVKDALAMMKKSGYQDIPVIENGNYVAMFVINGMTQQVVDSPELRNSPEEEGHQRRFQDQESYGRCAYRRR